MIFSEWTHDNQILNSDFVCIHYHICKKKSKIIECIIFARCYPAINSILRWYSAFATSKPHSWGINLQSECTIHCAVHHWDCCSTSRWQHCRNRRLECRVEADCTDGSGHSTQRCWGRYWSCLAKWRGLHRLWHRPSRNQMGGDSRPRSPENKIK